MGPQKKHLKDPKHVFKLMAKKYLQFYPQKVSYLDLWVHRFMYLYISRDARKPVFRVSDKARLKPVSSATETS